MDTEERLKKESDDFIKIGELLKKKRPTESADKIKTILESHDNPSEMIKKIDEIDKLFMENSKSVPIIEPNGKNTTFSPSAEGPKLSKSSLSEDEVKDLLKSENVITKSASVQYINNIKHNIKKNNFFIFLFSDYRKIRDFGRNTNLAYSKLIPPSFHFYNDVVKNFIYPIQKEALFIAEYMTIVLDNGWLYLNKRDYNICSSFYILLQSLISFKLTSLDYTSEFLLAKIKDIESSFLVCIYQSEYTSVIKGSMETVLGIYKKPPDQINSAKQLTDSFLAIDMKSQTLCNFILMINMMKCLHYIRITDLINRTAPGVINTFDYDASEAVRKKISSFLAENQRKCLDLKTSQKELDKLLKLLGPAEKKGMDDNLIYNLSILSEFYDQETPEKLKFNNDKENIGIFCLKYFSKFYTVFSTKLTGSFVIEGIGIVKAFAQELFQSDMNKISSLIEKYNMALPHIPDTSRADYQDYRTGKDKFEKNPVISDLFKIINELTDRVVIIGKRLAQVTNVVKKDPSPYIPGNIVPQITLGIYHSNEILVPYWDKPVMDNGFLFQKKFSSAVESMASLCLLTGTFLYHPEVCSLQETYDKIEIEFQHAFVNVLRTADPVESANFKRRLGPYEGQ